MKQNDNRRNASQRRGYRDNGNWQNGKRRDDNRRDMGPKDTTKAETHEKNPVGILDEVLADMAAEMDKGFMAYGKAVAELFRAMCEAAVKLPNMELQTDIMRIIRDDHGLTVVFTPEQKDAAEDKKHDSSPWGPKFDDDEEEGRLYDGD